MIAILLSKKSCCTLTWSIRLRGLQSEVSSHWTIDTPLRIYGTFAAARTWLFVIDEWFSDRRQRGPESSKEPVRHCTSLGVIVSDCTLISTLHSALPLLVHLSSISGLRKWDIRSRRETIDLPCVRGSIPVVAARAINKNQRVTRHLWFTAFNN